MAVIVFLLHTARNLILDGRYPPSRPFPANSWKHKDLSFHVCLEDFLWKVGLKDRKSRLNNKRLYCKQSDLSNLLLNIHKNFRFGYHFFSHRFGLVAFMNQLWSFKDIVLGMILGTLYGSRIMLERNYITQNSLVFFFQFCNIENMACLSKEMSKIGLIYTPKTLFPIKKIFQFYFIFYRKDKKYSPKNSGLLQLETASKGTSNL